MTQDKIRLISDIMSQLDIDIQNYVIDMLRHLKFAQTTLQKQDDSLYQNELPLNRENDLQPTGI